MASEGSGKSTKRSKKRAKGGDGASVSCTSTYGVAQAELQFLLSGFRSTDRTRHQVSRKQLEHGLPQADRLGYPEGKKKKKSKSRKPKEAPNASGMPSQAASSKPRHSGAHGHGNSNMQQNGGGSARGSRESTVIGTGHFVASSLPQIGKKRKLASMLQGQQGQSRYKKAYTPWCADIDWFSAPNMTSL